MDLHDLVAKLKEMAIELKRPPKRAEFTAVHCTREYIEKVAGGWTPLLQMAGLHKAPGLKIIPEQPSLAKPPKIVFLDIETSLMVVETFGIYEQNISPDQVVEDWFVMCYAAKIEDKMYFLDQRFSIPMSDESMILVAMHHILSDADIVIGHNLDRFDLPKLRARFIKHGLVPIGGFRTIDTLKIARRHFKITSNKLEFLANYLGCTPKEKHKAFAGRELWRECRKGNMAAWDEMEKYCKQDVETLIEVYQKLVPYDRSINFGMFSHESTCSCGSTEFEPYRVETTNAGKFELVRCVNPKCRAIKKRRENLLHPELRKALLK